MPMVKKRSRPVSMRSWILCAVLLFAFHVHSQNAKKLIGKWNWIEASGGITGEISTPQTTGKKVRVEFNKKGICKEWENDKLVYSKPFKVEKVKRASIESPVEFIKYGSKSDQMQQRMSERFEFKGKDTLVLIQDCPDCYTNIYVRIK